MPVVVLRAKVIKAWKGAKVKLEVDDIVWVCQKTALAWLIRLPSSTKGSTPLVWCPTSSLEILLTTDNELQDINILVNARNENIPEDYLYDDNAFLEHGSAVLVPGELTRSTHRLWHNFGFATQRFNNMFYLDDKTLIMVNGNNVRLVDIESLQSFYISGKDGGGVGALTVSSDSKYFAVAEKARYQPNVYIYQYPSLKVKRVYGTKLATVGSAPDYMLTVWDWMAEKVILRTKAFSQEVFNVSFFPQNDGILTTSGIGHIRFWKMARTFTGLKLQGDIGKFGKVDLSDVQSYAEMPGGLMHVLIFFQIRFFFVRNFVPNKF
eukprot:GSMAST32.ASY1.ANO1.1540.1 assembled CDS